MRTSWRLSRPIGSATRGRRVEPGTPGRRAARAWLLAALVLALVLGLSGCGPGGGSDSAARPTTDRSGTRPAPSGTESPSETTAEPTRPPRTSGDTPTSDRTPTTAERPDSPTTTPERSAEALAPASAPETSPAGAPAAAESEGLGALGWTLLILLVVALAVGWLLWRSRKRSAWDSQAAALEQDTRTATGNQLPPVLTAEDAGQRALSWPPLRATLVDLMHRWDLLAERAPDDQRRNRTGQVRNLLQELVAAVDSENEALATGRDWRLLRPRVDQAERALSAVLAGVPQQQPSAAGEPWQPAPGG
jgi:cbb3-type cytochrome oxidase subunit 3